MAPWDIRILSSRAESISHEFASLTRERYFQNEKIKFVSPRSHVISSMSLWKLSHFLHDLKHILKQPMVHSNWQEELKKLKFNDICVLSKNSSFCSRMLEMHVSEAQISNLFLGGMLPDPPSPKTCEFFCISA